MEQSQIIDAFCTLGECFAFSQNTEKAPPLKYSKWIDQWRNIEETHGYSNPWFSKREIQRALREWIPLLSSAELSSFTAPYAWSQIPARVLVISPSNIPLVEFHDFLCVLLSGNTYVGKLSSENNIILPWVSRFLQEFLPDLKDRVEWLSSPNTDFQAVITTGSNISTHYFEKYYGHVPSLYRGNKKTTAILSEETTDQEIQLLLEDVFAYFGKGCRSVSHVFLPEGFDIQRIFQHSVPFAYVMDNYKYANNYDYHKALFLMENIPYLENNILLVKEEESLNSPLSVLNYSYYTDFSHVKQTLKEWEKELQCICSNISELTYLPLGSTQQPKLQDFADNRDTMHFLNSI